MRPPTQAEADLLIKMEKRAMNDTVWEYPPAGGKIEIPLEAVSAKEQFILDLSRGRIKLEKRKYQNRTRVTVILLRLDIGGSPHENPDGEVIECPHLHVYTEGLNDKVARRLNVGEFSDLSNSDAVLSDFMRLCNIVQPPRFTNGLFR